MPFHRRSSLQKSASVISFWRKVDGLSLLSLSGHVVDLGSPIIFAVRGWVVTNTTDAVVESLVGVERVVNTETP